LQAIPSRPFGASLALKLSEGVAINYSRGDAARLKAIDKPLRQFIPIGNNQDALRTVHFRNKHLKGSDDASTRRPQQCHVALRFTRPSLKKAQVMWGQGATV
jgi:hypothetical protein